MTTRTYLVTGPAADALEHALTADGARLVDTPAPVAAAHAELAAEWQRRDTPPAGLLEQLAALADTWEENRPITSHFDQGHAQALRGCVWELRQLLKTYAQEGTRP